jgi:hypothetical protein
MRSFAVWLVLFWTTTRSWAFEPDFDKHVGLSPTNVTQHGVVFHHFTNVDAVEIQIPQRFEHLPFEHAMLALATTNRLLQVPVQPRKTGSSLVLSFWLDPELLREATMTIRYQAEGDIRGARMHLPFRLFVAGVQASHNQQGGANGRQPVSSDTNSTSAAAASRRSP